MEKKIALGECRKNKFKFAWDEYIPQKPKFTGLKVFNEISIKKYVILLTGNLFSIMGITRKLSQILSDEKVGKATKDLYGDALNMLEDIIKKNLVKPSAVVGFGPPTQN